MHFESIGYSTGSLITSLEARVTAAMWQHTRTDSYIDQLTLTPLDGAGTSVTYSTTNAAKWKGVNGTGDLIPQAAVINKFTTTLRGRSFRGRAYLPWPAEVACNNGVYDASARALQDTAWGNFIAGMSVDAHSLVVASYKESAATLVVGHQCEPLLGTQRRRQIRPS
jgi:hypothetical protein